MVWPHSIASEEDTMWAPMAFGLLIGVVAQATNGSVGLAIAFGILLLIVVGLGVRSDRARRRVS
jgi:hypothetical protein